MDNRHTNDPSVNKDFGTFGLSLESRLTGSSNTYRSERPVKNTISNLILKKTVHNGYYTYSTHKYNNLGMGLKAKTVIFSSHPIPELEMYLSKKSIKDKFKKENVPFNKNEKTSGGFVLTGAFLLSGSFLGDIISQTPGSFMDGHGLTLALGSVFIGDTVRTSISTRRERTARKIGVINLFNQDSLSNLSTPYLVGKYDGEKYSSLTPGGERSKKVPTLANTLSTAEKHSGISADLKELGKDDSRQDELFSSHIRMALAEEGQQFLAASVDKTQDSETQSWAKEGYRTLKLKIEEEQKNIEELHQEASNERETKTFTDVFSYVNNL